MFSIYTYCEIAGRCSENPTGTKGIKRVELSASSI